MFFWIKRYVLIVCVCVCVFFCVFFSNVFIKASRYIMFFQPSTDGYLTARVGGCNIKREM